MRKISVLIILCMLLSMPALAADIRLYSDIRAGHLLYLGVYNGEPIEWLVLDDKYTSMPGTKGMFLITNKLLFPTELKSAEFIDSGLRDACANLFNGTTFSALFNGPTFSDLEKGLVFSTSVEASDSYDLNYHFENVKDCAVNGEKIFLPSIKELNKYAHFVSLACKKPYCTRTEVTYPVDGIMVIGTNGDYSYYGSAQDSVYFRPAMNIDPKKILFVSSAQGGKGSGLGLFPIIPDRNICMWKATFLDENIDFEVLDTYESRVYSDERTLKLEFSSSEFGLQDYVSAILLDREGNPLFYGPLCECIGSEDKLEVTLPDNLENGSYKLKVFQETRNGDNKSDYASRATTVSFSLEDRSVDPPAEGKELPETGDGANIALWLGMIAMAAVGMKVLMKKKNA